MKQWVTVKQKMVELIRQFQWAIAAQIEGGGLLPSGGAQVMWDGWVDGV